MMTLMKDIGQRRIQKQRTLITIFKRIAEIDKKKHIKNDKKEAIDDNRTIEQAVQKVLQKKKQGRKKIMY